MSDYRVFYEPFFRIGLNNDFFHWFKSKKFYGRKLRTYGKNAFFVVYAESHYLNLGALSPTVSSDVDPDPFGSVDPEV